MVVLDGGPFHERFRRTLAPLDAETRRMAAALRARVTLRRALVVTLMHRHDQSTIWWFEQGLLSLLAAAGCEISLVTDATYVLDDFRLEQLRARIETLRAPTGETPARIPRGSFDAVIALAPSDYAVRAARTRNAPLVAFSVKKPYAEQKVLAEAPPEGTPIWHAFAGSDNFERDWWLGPNWARWRLRGAPFPVNRYYFPPSAVKPEFDALIFGSKGRDLGTACTAFAKAKLRRVALLSNPEDLDRARAAADAAGLDARITGPLQQEDLLGLIHHSRLIVNPILPPEESHYSVVLPLAAGRPVLVNDIPPTRVFTEDSGGGVVGVPPGDADALAAALTRLADPDRWRTAARAALKQAHLRHDMDRFFASAIAETIG